MTGQLFLKCSQVGGKEMIKKNMNFLNFYNYVSMLINLKELIPQIKWL